MWQVKRLSRFLFHAKETTDQGEQRDTGMKRIGISLLFILPATLCLLMLAVFAATFQFWLFMNLPGSARPQVREFNIESGMSASAIAQLLQHEGVVSDAEMFYLLCLLKGAGQKLQAGEYAFSSFSTPSQILDQIVEGKVLLHRVTVPEGSTLADVAAILQHAGLASIPDILQLARDRTFVDELHIESQSLEGYLFPETYYFSKSESERAILKSMVHQFRQHFPGAWKKQAQEMGLSVNQVVIMASMVEKEAVVDSERPIIAGVFFNRLKLDMPLQSDPTAVYDLPDFSGPITREHLQRQSPYNTYKNKGLPIGPICNPGARSIEAVLYPAKVRYLYFVSNNDGTHRFSATLEEHHRAVSLYRKNNKNNREN